MGGFSTMQALSTWDGDPKLASKPFDIKRDGFVPLKVGNNNFRKFSHAKKEMQKFMVKLQVGEYHQMLII